MSVNPLSADTIRRQYQDLYGKGHLSLSANYSDKFPLLEHLLRDEVRGRRVLDFGCGPGRLALMLARHARHVHGVDYAGEGVELAAVLAKAARATNVTFAEGDLARLLQQSERYDVIVLAGVLEHLERPLDQLSALAGLLTDGGLLCVQSPSFQNFRGDVYNTLNNLIGLPMSLTDLWQVTPRVMREAVQFTGLRLEKTVGGHYRLAWLERVLEDFWVRVPNAARDAAQGTGWKWDAFFAWLAERIEQNQLLIDVWETQGWLRPVPPSQPLAADRPDGIDDETWGPIERYLTYDGWREPWYSDVAPICYHGASAIYLLRR